LKQCLASLRLWRSSFIHPCGEEVARAKNCLSTKGASFFSSDFESLMGEREAQPVAFLCFSFTRSFTCRSVLRHYAFSVDRSVVFWPRKRK